MTDRWRARWADGRALLPMRLRLLLAFGPVFGVLGGTFSWVIGSRVAPHPTPGDAFLQIVLHNVLVWTMWVALIPAILVLGNTVRITRPHWRHAVAAHALLGLAIATFYCGAGGTLKFVQLSLAGQTTWGSVPMTWGAVVRSQFLFHFEWQFLVYWGIVGVSHALRFHRDVQARELREARLQARLMEAQLESLQRQLHPHFLFNTLHAIGAVMRRDLDAADQMIDRLAVLLRALMRSETRQTVRLDEELALTQQYLAIERVRFGARLTTSVEAAEALGTALVPCLLLQPLVENAVRHGLAPRVDGGWVRITARQQRGRLQLQVADNGVGLPEQGVRDGIGLANTRARLEQLYPGQHVLLVQPRPRGGVLVTIDLPLQRPVDDDGARKAGVASATMC